MGIGSITSTNSISIMQVTSANFKDQKSKSIHNKISDVQQQMQKLSSKEDLSVNEKASERRKFQKEIAGLNTELEQHHEELLRSQRREQMLAELQEDKKPANGDAPKTEALSEEAALASSDTADQKTLPSDRQRDAQPGSIVALSSDGTVILKEITKQVEDHDIDTETTQADEVEEKSVHEPESENRNNGTAADSRPSEEEISAMVSADSTLQQAGRLGSIIAKTSDGVAILKEEIEQARDRGIDTERQQAALNKIARQEQLAMAFQSSLLGAANNAMKSVTDPESSKDKITDTENNAYINALNLSQKDLSAQQKFYVSFG